MKVKTFFLMLIICLMPCVNNASAPAVNDMLARRQADNIRARQAFSADIQRKVDDITKQEGEAALNLKNNLFTRYNPTPERCKPGIVAQDKAPFYKTLKSSLLKGDGADSASEFEGSIACMLKDYKAVYSGYFNEFSSLSAAMKDLMRLQGFDYIVLSEGISPSLLIYTPRGKEAALLLAKESQNRLLGNAFVEGWLLGYTDPDIRAYYKRVLTNRDVEADKQQALNWILEHKPNIQIWAQEHIDPATKTLKPQ